MESNTSNYLAPNEQFFTSEHPKPSSFCPVRVGGAQLEQEDPEPDWEALDEGVRERSRSPGSPTLFMRRESSQGRVNTTTFTTKFLAKELGSRVAN